LTVPTAEQGLTVSQLAARAGAFQLSPIDLEVPPDRVLVVLGPSGAGKTMLLETIAGLRPQVSGQVHLAGTELTHLPPERRRIGMVFQDAALFPHMSVRENVRFGLRASARTQGQAADGLLGDLGIAHLAGRSPRSLSGGERQRVALARALAIAPGLLLLDEPLSALDQPTREEMRGLLQELLTRLEIPAVHVTHDRDEAASLADDLAVIVAGTLRQAGPARQVTAEPADQAVARLLGWSELGSGISERGTLRIGQLTLRVPGPEPAQGPAHAYYRPEDVLLGADATTTPADARLTARIRQIVPTRPLARISLAATPAISALLLHRDIKRLGLQTGQAVDAALPPGTIRIFPSVTLPELPPSA
jgi:ABC-type sulfate/molybdate transport systems ATPase subunit